MARTPQTTIPDGTAYGKYLKRTMTNLGVAGVHGYAPNLTDWLSSQAYMRNQAVMLLFEYPKAFDLFYEPKTWISSLKSLLETRVKSFEGIYYDALEVAKVDHEVGGAGQVFHEISDVKMKQSSLTVTVVSQYGLSIETMLAAMIRAKMDPHTKTSMLGTLPDSKVPKDLLADWYTFSALIYEPCPLNRVVHKAAVGCNLFPTLNGDGSLVLKRNLNEASNVEEISIQLDGLWDSGPGVVKLAQAVLDRINFNNAMPTYRPAFIQGRENAVANASGGYDTNAEFLGQQVTNMTFADQLPTSVDEMISSTDNFGLSGTAVGNYISGNKGVDTNTVFDHTKVLSPHSGPIVGRPSATASGGYNGQLGST